jgi:hypothetical protein
MRFLRKMPLVAIFFNHLDALLAPWADPYWQGNERYVPFFG